MGFSTCPICTEELKEDIVTTKCGHIFHELCITQWLKTKRVCPTCRTHATSKGLIKLFLNSNDDSFYVPKSQQAEVSDESFQNCIRLNEQLNKKVTELNDSITKLKEAAEMKNKAYEDLVKAKVSQDREFSNMRQTCSNLRTKMKYMVEDADKTRQMEVKLNQLEREVKTMRGLKIILEGSKEEVEELVDNTSDVQTMAHFIAGLKRDYASLQKSKTEVQSQAEDLQRKLSYSRVTAQTLREENDQLKSDKQHVEQDLSVAERKNDALSRRIGEFEDRSHNNTTLNGSGVRRSLDQQTPIQLGKRQRKQQSTPNLFDNSFNDLTREFEEELSRDDELDRMAAELGVDINMASTPGKPELRPKTFHEDNLFTKVGFDGLGGTARIRKPLRPTNSTPQKGSKSSSSSLVRSATIGNFFRKHS